MLVTLPIMLFPYAHKFSLLCFYFCSLCPDYARASQLFYAKSILYTVHMKFKQFNASMLATEDKFDIVLKQWCCHWLKELLTVKNPLCCRSLDSGDLLGRDKSSQVTYNGPRTSIRNFTIMPENVPIMLALCSMLARPYYAPNYAGIIRPSLARARDQRCM